MDIDMDMSLNSLHLTNPFIVKKRKIISAPSLRSVSIFKTSLPLDVFYTFSEQMCGQPVESSKIMHILKSGNGILSDQDLSDRLFFTFDSIAFKRGIYLDVIEPFMKLMASQYYRPAYAFYAERPMAGSSAFIRFIQVIRHISKHIGLMFISTVKYEQSVSSKVYYVEYKLSNKAVS
jgi:hypothetical protein